MSTQPCGCDLEAGWTCERHRLLDPDTFCLKHGKPLLKDARGRVTAYCDDCEGKA